MSVELIENYVKGSRFRFEGPGQEGLLTTNHARRVPKRVRGRQEMRLFNMVNHPG
jgi:hypothetical protein